MKCPMCGCTKSRVLASKMAKEKEWYRRRECADCGVVYTTREILDDEYYELSKTHEELKKVYAILKKVFE